MADQLTREVPAADQGVAEKPVEEAFGAQREIFEKLAVWEQLGEFRQIARQVEEANRSLAVAAGDKGQG